MIANLARWGTEQVHVYQCGYAKQRGPSVCKNTLRRPAASFNEKVLDWICDTVLTPEIALKIIADIRAEHLASRPEAEGEAKGLEREAARLKKEVDRLVKALAMFDSDKPDAVVREITQRQAHLREIEGRMAALRTAPQVAEEQLARFEKAALEVLKDRRRALRDDPEQARRIVASLFSQMTFDPVASPEGQRYRVEGLAEVGSLLFSEEAKVASPGGFEPPSAA